MSIEPVSVGGLPPGLNSFSAPIGANAVSVLQ